MRVRRWIAGLGTLGLTALWLVGSGCAGGTATEPVGEQVTRQVDFQISRGPEAQAAQASWELGYSAFIPEQTVEGVTIGSTNFIRRIDRTQDPLRVIDGSHIYITNDTGKPMRDAVLAIVSVANDPATGSPGATFEPTSVNFGDLAAGAGGPGSDDLVLEDTERLWSYVWTPSVTSDEYIATLSFTARLTWTTDAD